MACHITSRPLTILSMRWKGYYSSGWTDAVSASHSLGSSSRSTWSWLSFPRRKSAINFSKAWVNCECIYLEPGALIGHARLCVQLTKDAALLYSLVRPFNRSHFLNSYGAGLLEGIVSTSSKTRFTAQGGDGSGVLNSKWFNHSNPSNNSGHFLMNLDSVSRWIFFFLE